ncbi:MAG: InlB B-repeat-containing protein [Alphaproteobacteria bacterium]|nr:InlB B-repeat-containing protein [Alphaproteobacteria bacterium]
MGKIRKFLGFLAFLCVCTFGANAFADPEIITLHWNPGYGNSMPDTTCEFGGTFSVPTAPEVTGRVIASWSVNGHIITYNQQNVPCDFDMLGVTSGTTTLQGKYEPVQYDIIYHSNGGGIRPDNPDTYDIDTDVYLGPIVREHSYFSGWYANTNFSGDEIDYIPLGTTGQIDLYAKWECEENYNDTTDINSCVPNTYNVNFSCGAGTGTPPVAKIATYADVLLTPANTCSRSGWIFNGWSVSGTDDIKKENFGFTWMYTESKTLTAHWIQTPGNCTRGKYYDSTTSSCKTCPSGYTSDLGAEGINKCYTTCQTLCEHEVASDMPEYVLSNKFSNVTYDFSAMVDGIKYYGSSECKTDILCPYVNVACQGNTFSPVGRYYTGVTDFYNEFGEKNTNICALCPIEYPYSLLGNDTPITNCFQYHAFDCATDPDLTKDPLATCELELNNVTGVVYYPNEINDANTKKYKQQCRWVLPCSCPSGYTASLTEAKCNPNVYTITLSDTAGSGGVGVIYEKFATGFVLDQDSTNYITTITKPTLTNKVFFGYWDAPTGGKVVIDKNGVLPSAYKFTESVTLYARWVDELFQCTTGKSADNTSCTPGYYCPGEEVVKIERFDENTGCELKCPASDVANTTVASPSGSTSITQCYSTTSGVELPDGNGGGNVVCYHDNDTDGDYDNNSCQDVEITYCNAGYYKSPTDPTKCVKTDEGYWSPGPTDTINGDPTSTQQYSCSSLTGAINATTSGQGAKSPTECYNVCTPKTISNGTTTVDNAKAYYNASASAYNLCTYNATCNPGYSSVNNHTNTPSCNPASYTVTYSCGLGTGIAPSPDTATYGSAFTPANNTGCIKPGYSFAGWDDGIATHVVGTSFTWNFTTDKELVAQWTPNVYKITLDDNDATTSSVPSTIYMKYGDGWYSNAGATQKIYSLVQLPTKTGYEFAAYKSGDTVVIDSDGKFVNNTFTTQNTSIQAIWEVGNCMPGYYAKGSECVACRPGFYCDGTDGGVGDGSTQCPTSGDAFTTWNGSNIMATKIEDCYATCLQRNVTYGTAYPVTGKETVNYPELCEFYGVSETGNPCDKDELANGVCIESACHGAFEMKNGVCSPCNRDANALTYEENGNCIVKTCKDGFHPSIYACVENKKDCTNMIPNATEAFLEWNITKNAFGTCNVSKCADGYHISANACVLDDQTCVLPHGIGTHEWDDARGQWGPCIATSCDAGYTSDPDEKLPGSSDQCGECKNKYVNGEQAVSSYVSGCEIASCMYQGEKFALNGDRCEAICLADMWDHDDKLVSIGWNQGTKKCERKCKPGYIPY